MPLIIVSADDFSQGREIAHRVAGVLGYRYVGRDLLASVAEQHQVSQEELVQALEDPPGFLTRRSRRQRLLAFIEEGCLQQLQDDGVVCYGLAGHLYVRGIAHALKVRIITEVGQWAQAIAESEGVPLERAQKVVERRKEEQKRWSQDAYNLDQSDPSLYDMVLSLDTLEPDKAVEIICDTAGYRKFQAMTYSRKLMQDKALASRVRVELMKSFPDIKVEANDGTVVAYLQSLKKDQRKKQEAVRQLAGGIEGVRHVEVHVIRDYFGQAAQSSR
ncbi:MAG: cytidylate kinase family protein [Desulfarculaceae bacterium]|nr:cytidylate kinase family protein [Desulfarculaceae bacterium]MCF8072148.1 cytidylate kinase family protein [Desulfarculaceae bacterium]MCF8100069.1 cytidylate kinase family protein [Desulfarculaceae bacterium]MCF8118276.1 cytidylate kinase family protein [Desulfarculaceae bacterium]